MVFDLLKSKLKMFNGTELLKLIFAGELNLLLAANTIFMY